ncbi:MAG: hypothetical protein H7X88_10780 [Gloeobacteraceae cyanobacterium ES-bin-316]|nr:hypothetical protein [Ferruginibacter sp.]
MCNKFKKNIYFLVLHHYVQNSDPSVNPIAIGSGLSAATLLLSKEQNPERSVATDDDPSSSLRTATQLVS